jgi:hypothetical protein
MPTTKTISHIGDTKFELVKDTYDAFRFTVDDKSSNPNSPKTVMYISSEPTSSSALDASLVVGGDGDIGVGGKILIREGTGTGTATRAAIYAEKDTSSDNHRLILDPYREDDADNSDSTNNGTVYIRGNLIVEGNKTILDTAEHITSENLFGINAVRDSGGNTTGGAATAAGIHVYSGSADTQFLYNFVTSRWRTAAATASSLNDLEAKDVYITDLTAASGDFGTGNVTAGTFTGNLTGDVTGNVTGQVSSIANHTTTDLSEGSTNLYYTDARARSAISLDTGETFLKYNNSTGKLSTDPAAHFLGGLGDVTLTSVAGSDILTYDASASKWVNSDSLTIKSTAGANFSNQTGSIVTEGGLVIKSTQALDISGASQETALVCMGGAYFADLTYSTKLSCGEEANLGPFTLSKRDSANSNPDQHSIIFTDNRASTGNTTHRIFDVEHGTDTGGNANYKRNLGDDTIHVVSRGVSARTIGNIVPVELSSSGGRSSTKTISATVTTAPLHADILNYYSGKAFAAGKCVVALTNGTHSSVAMFSFSVCASVLTMVLDQEVHSSSAVLNVDYDSSGTIDLNLGTASSAVYCVKVLPIMTSDSITEQV